MEHSMEHSMGRSVEPAWQLAVAAWVGSDQVLRRHDEDNARHDVGEAQLARRFVWGMGEMLAYRSHFRVSCVHWYSAKSSCAVQGYLMAAPVPLVLAEQASRTMKMLHECMMQ